MPAADWLLLAAEEERNVLIPAVYELVWGTLSFIIFLAVMAKFVMPRARQMLQERTEGIEGKLEQAERDRQEAENLLAQYRSQLEEARDEAQQLRDDARAQGENIRQELRSSAEAEQRRILEQGEAQLAAERQQTLNALRREVGEIAVALAGRIVGESLEDDARQRRTVDRFLDQLDGMEGAESDGGAGSSGEGSSSSGGSSEDSSGSGSSRIDTAPTATLPRTDTEG
jgi:F-type H+-transporting ATPase subunit b